MNKYEAKLKLILKDFSQSSGKLHSGIFSGFYKYSVPSSYDMWRLVRFLFNDILHFQIADQPMEKINWEIPFIYKDKYLGSAAHQKFGFRIYVAEKDSAKAEKIAKEITLVINHALDSAEPMIRGFAEKALNNGEISVDNKIFELKKPYEYFRSQVLMRKARVDGKLSISLGKKLPKNWQKLFETREEIGHLEQAGYVAFFGLLEHLCVLFLAFKDIHDRKNVREFSSKIWQDKFKIIFDLQDKEFKDIYDYFLGISRYRRNPGVHGFSDKLHTAFQFYLPGARHRVPVSLYGREILMQWHNTEVNFAKLDMFLKLLHKHKTTKRIMAYLDAGLNVSFSGGLGEYKLMLECSEKEFKEYLKYTICKNDDMGNMDW